jgi:nucleotide-binding universal stress UspA family protein
MHGQAAAALVETADADDLVVVGTRGHGGFVGLLLGSVSQQVAQHARCPVVIVRGSNNRGSAES